MGAWTFVAVRLFRLLGADYQIRPATRIESGSPASGSAALHALEHADLIDRSFADL